MNTALLDSSSSFCSADDFHFVRRLIRDSCGITLEDGKEYLVEARLLPLAIQQGLTSIREIFAKIRDQPWNNDLRKAVIEAMTTNETFFFRDVHAFDVLKKRVIPRLIADRSSEKKLNIWCAGCSSGQEPYSIAMLLRESFPQLQSWSITLMASDISEQMIERTREGRYNQLEVNRGLPASLLVKYFLKKDREWQIKDEIRKMVRLFRFDLSNYWPQLPIFDIIFARNVIIYFDIPIRQNILGKLQPILRKDGSLFLGPSESTMELGNVFEQIQADKTSYFKLKN